MHNNAQQSVSARAVCSVQSLLKMCDFHLFAMHVRVKLLFALYTWKTFKVKPENILVFWRLIITIKLMRNFCVPSIYTVFDAIVCCAYVSLQSHFFLDLISCNSLQFLMLDTSEDQLRSQTYMWIEYSLSAIHIYYATWTSSSRL